MAKKKTTKKETTKKVNKGDKVLVITEAEFKNPMMRRKISELIILRAGFHSTEPFIPISKAEVDIMNDISLFTPLKAYKIKQFPNEVGKLKGKRVCVIN